MLRSRLASLCRVAASPPSFARAVAAPSRALASSLTASLSGGIARGGSAWGVRWLSGGAGEKTVIEGEVVEKAAPPVPQETVEGPGTWLTLFQIHTRCHSPCPVPGGGSVRCARALLTIPYVLVLHGLLTPFRALFSLAFASLPKATWQPFPAPPTHARCQRLHESFVGILESMPARRTWGVVGGRRRIC